MTGDKTGYLRIVLTAEMSAESNGQQAEEMAFYLTFYNKNILTTDYV